MNAILRTSPMLVVGALLASSLAAQSSVADTSAFRPLDLPAPSVYRTGSGRPGPQYWQQRVDYRIDATLDVAKNEIAGRETVHYQNNSPDRLDYLWMHVEQNICAPSSVTSKLNQPPLVFQGTAFDFSCKGFAGGFTLERISVAGRSITPVVDGTIMRVDLPSALAPGASLDLDIVWRFPMPEYGAGRMGRDGQLWEVAQWYPRVAVYDDVRGWNHEPYLGAGEFYLEYGRFDVALTVPASYVVAATGRLLNPEQVLTPAQRERLARAATSETPVAIIGATEVGTPASRPAASGTLTWRFAADSVRDFAFAAAPNWRWDASGYQGVMINTLYRTSAPLWAAESNKMARAAIAHFSEQWLRYPYPHATTVEGPIEGMEYPMLTFVPKGLSREDLQWTLSHEFGHEWFPMIVGANERLYPWMDEGFNTFIDIEGAEKYFAGTPYADTVGLNPMHLYAAHGVPGDEQPLIARPIEVRDLFWSGYRKPALMLQLLRLEVLGRERFDFAFREYTRAWAFKHPTPADFFRVMRDASGQELDWFWRGWIYSTARLDQSVDSIATRADGGSEIHLSNRGTMVMPAELELTYADGTTEVVRLPVDMWNLGRGFAYRVPGTRIVRSALLDPREVYPDIERANNRR
ncbi:MAG: M1 family peptidase [Gemmatimonadetes bacterium]|nr:M1 family peptidase [Gemmatimonadota bacterium]